MLTPEQLAEQEARAQRAARERQRIDEREATEVRAKTLLLEHLTPEQKDSLEKFMAFYVQTASGRRFQIRQHGRVKEYVGDKSVAEYCINSVDSYVPSFDEMLSKKLLLETDELEFLRGARRTPMP